MHGRVATIPDGPGEQPGPRPATNARRAGAESHGHGAVRIYNWKTPVTPGKCVRLDLRFNDGTTQSANFKLK